MTAEELLSQDATETVRERLLSPSKAVDLDGLREAWFHMDLRWCIADFGCLVDDPGLPGRIRGAFGIHLLETASPDARVGRPCPWQPPCAFEVLFRRQGRMDRAFDFPAPWVILVDAQKSDLVVTLRLFGFATDFSPAAIEAMTYALAHRVDFRGSNRLFLPTFEITSRWIEIPDLPCPDLENGELELELLSPLTMTGTSPLDRPQSLLTTFAARLSGLARWMDSSFDMDRAMLRDAAAALEFDWRNVHPVTWKRHSSRQGKTISMGGILGSLTIGGDRAALRFAATLLSFGEAALIGADIAFGCGRFRISV